MNPYVDPREQLVVELPVADLTASKAFYQSLGFELFHESEGFVSLIWEGHRLFLDQLRGTPAGDPRINIRVMVADVDRVWERVSHLKLRVVTPIGDRSYGLRDFTIADPDGFGLRFATRIGDGGG